MDNPKNQACHLKIPKTSMFFKIFFSYEGHLIFHFLKIHPKTNSNTQIFCIYSLNLKLMKR